MTQEDKLGDLKLNPSDQQTLQGIAHEQSENGRRAQMLLALAGGDELATAADKSGLTTNQARYWRGRFRSQGLSVFPKELIAQHTAVPALPRHERPGLLSAPPAAPLLESPPAREALTAGTVAATGKKKGGSKKKDKKKGTGKRKGKKKSQKDKKGKKGKKSAKKSKSKQSKKKK